MIRKFEKDIISSLHPGHLCKFAAALAEYGIIENKIKRNIDIMHEEVPHDKKCRYLMLQAYKQLQQKIYMCNCFQILQKKITNFNTLLTKMIEYQKEGKITKETVTGTSDVILSGKNHIKLIYEHLVTISHKWEEIARLLLHDSNVIAKIRLF